MSKETNNNTLQGVGKDAETVVNEAGGKQSKANYRYDLLDTDAMFALTKTLAEGAVKYGEWNWHDISEDDHLNHALIHIFAHLHGDKQDEHLAHAFCRIMFAYGVNKS